jgi:hypothetical protein
MIQPPKMKTPLIEKYKSLLADAISSKTNENKNVFEEDNIMKDITSEFYTKDTDDNESVYSAGYSALRDEMGDELAELIV